MDSNPQVDSPDSVEGVESNSVPEVDPTRVEKSSSSPVGSPDDSVELPEPQKRRAAGGAGAGRQKGAENGTAKKAAPGPKKKRAPKQPKDQTGPKVPSNWQRKAHVSDKMGPMNFVGAVVEEEGLKVVLEDDTTLKSGDFVYVLAEPVGEPYYIGRVMEFVPIETPTKPESTDLADKYLARINWLYRPCDVNKRAADSRELLVTMHSDNCSLQSIRGKCIVRSSHSVPDLDAYLETPNTFWFNRMWDRYIERFFDVVPTSRLTNIPQELQPALQARSDFVVIEPIKTKEALRPSRSCGDCKHWATEGDSVQCMRCDTWFHMACLNPPMSRKLARGFGWSCAACNLAAEKKYNDTPRPTSKRRRLGSDPGETVPADNTVSMRSNSDDSATGDDTIDGEGDWEHGMETEDDMGKSGAPEPLFKSLLPLIEKHTSGPSPQQQREAKMWPFRYLGVHAKYEDIFDDDNIHPRAASRIGPKHQANVKDWPGRPVVYYKNVTLDKRKRGPKSRSQNGSNAKYEPPDLDRSLAWVQEMPVGYIERGGDSTSTLCWSSDKCGTGTDKLEDFLKKAEPYAANLGLSSSSVNFMDAALRVFMESTGDEIEALKQVSTFTRKSLKEPTFTEEEKKLFGEAVTLYGNKLHLVYKHVKSKTSADIVRFYYLWKKTKSGQQIWNNCQARTSRRKAHTGDQQFAKEIADDRDPVTGYSVEKIKKLKKTIECKYCHASSSRDWRRAPGQVPSSEEEIITALCVRCARLWYRYSVVWEPPEEVARLLALKGNAKVRVDPELVEDTDSIVLERQKYTATGRRKPRAELPKRQSKPKMAAALGETTPTRRRKKAVKTEDPNGQELNGIGEEPVVSSDRPDSDKAAPIDTLFGESGTSPSAKNEVATDVAPAVKVHVVDDTPTTEIAPSTHDNDALSVEELDNKYTTAVRKLYGEQRPFTEEIKRVRDPPSYCAVCCQLDPSFPQLACNACGLIVHAACYGYPGDTKNSGDSVWYCDCCANDKNINCSYLYTCELCPVRPVPYASWIAGDNADLPDGMKQTCDNKWCHVRCSVWVPKVTYDNPKKLCPVDIGDFTAASSTPGECSICKRRYGACVACDVCSSLVHVSCAGSQGYLMGFSLSPPRGADKVVTYQGRTGVMTAIVRCLAHGDKDMIPMSDIDDEIGLTAMQLYVQTYKAPRDSVRGAARLARTLPAVNRPQTAKLKPLVISISAPHTSGSGSGSADFPSFLTTDVAVCDTCSAKESGYWFRASGSTVVQCSGCYWRSKGSTAYDPPVDLNRVSAKLDASKYCLQVLNRVDEFNSFVAPSNALFESCFKSDRTAGSSLSQSPPSPEKRSVTPRSVKVNDLLV